MSLNCSEGERSEFILLCRREVGVYTVVYFGKERGGSLFCSVGEEWESTLLCILGRREVGVCSVVYFGKERDGISSVV